MPPKTDWDPKGPPPLTPAQRRQIEGQQRREWEKHRQEQEKRDKAEKQELRRKEQETDAWIEKNKPLWTDRRTKCGISLDILANQIRIRKDRWGNVAVDFTDAYEDAWNEFSGKLSSASAHSQLMWNLAFAALGMVTQGGLAVMVGKLGSKYLQGWAVDESKELFIAASTDAIQAGVGGVMSVLPGKLAETYPTQPIPSPLKYKGELEKLLNNMEADMLEWCSEQQKEIKDLPLSNFEDFEPSVLDRKINEFLAEKDKKFNSNPLPNQADKARLAKEIEKMMWGKWAADRAQEELSRSHTWGGKPHVFPNSIVDKLVEVGFVDDSGKWSDADVLKMADWGPNVKRVLRLVIQNAQSYHPRKFG